MIVRGHPGLGLKWLTRRVIGAEMVTQFGVEMMMQ
jgi:hypothetical protein